MKLLILGATGGTGRQLLEQALAQGHAVTAFVRNPAKINRSHENLRIVQGNILDEQAVTTVIEGPMELETLLDVNRISEDIGRIYRLSTINGCAAGSAFVGANRHGPHVIDESRKTGSRCASELPSGIVGKPHGTQHALGLRFNQPSDDCQHFAEWGAGENLLQNLKYRLAGKQARPILRLCDSR